MKIKAVMAAAPLKEVSIMYFYDSKRFFLHNELSSKNYVRNY